MVVVVVVLMWLRDKEKVLRQKNCCVERRPYCLGNNPFLQQLVFSRYQEFTAYLLIIAIALENILSTCSVSISFYKLVLRNSILSSFLSSFIHPSINQLAVTSSFSFPGAFQLVNSHWPQVCNLIWLSLLALFLVLSYQEY